MDVSQAQALLSLPDDKLVKKTPRHWLNGYDCTQLLTAIDSKAKTVYLNGLGREFNITYNQREGEVWIQAKNSFAPCAWVTVKALRKLVVESNVLATL